MIFFLLDKSQTLGKVSVVRSRHTLRLSRAGPGQAEPLRRERQPGKTRDADVFSAKKRRARSHPRIQGL